MLVETCAIVSEVFRRFGFAVMTQVSVFNDESCQHGEVDDTRHVVFYRSVGWSKRQSPR